MPIALRRLRSYVVIVVDADAYKQGVAIRAVVVLLYQLIGDTIELMRRHYRICYRRSEALDCIVDRRPYRRHQQHCRADAEK